MKILGINATFHDSAACLLVDGQLLAAAEEERFTRVKHHKRTKPFTSYALPFNAIDYCLKEGGILLADVEHVAYSFDPFPLLKASGANPELSLPTSADEAQSFQAYDPWRTIFMAGVTAAPKILLDYIPWELEERLLGGGNNHKWKFHFVPHHTAHAASAFFPSPFESAAVMTIDGYGGDASTTYGFGQGTRIEPLGLVNIPHSLGLVYEQVTSFLGFKKSSDEYKVMALAGLGEPSYAEEFRRLIQLEGNGQYRVSLAPLETIFGSCRRKGEPLEKRHLDIACSLQQVLEERVLQLAEWLHEISGSDNLCLAGGVALNCVMNAHLRDSSSFKRVWVQPAAGDAGTALGAALSVDAQENDRPRCSYRMETVYLGPGYRDEEIAEFLSWSKIPFRKLTNIAEEVAALLAANKIIGWFQGRMEFGPRALGARSILASPIQAEMQDRLNQLKGREEFRPVAPVVLEEEASQWFENATASPFMLFVYKVNPDKVAHMPAVKHVDGTARVQTVNRRDNALLYDLLKAFDARTGVPVLINTSFNTRGEPIVCTPRDAVEAFFSSPLDALIIGSYLLEKSL